MIGPYRVQALKRLRQVMANWATGTLPSLWMSAVCLADLSWRELGRSLGFRDITANAWAIRAINRLVGQPST